MWTSPSAEGVGPALPKPPLNESASGLASLAAIDALDGKKAGATRSPADLAEGERPVGERDDAERVREPARVEVQPDGTPTALISPASVVLLTFSLNDPRLEPLEVRLDGE